MGIVHTITEGGQIWTHRFRMFKQVIKVTFGFSFLVGLVVTVICMLSVPFVLYQGTWYYLKGYVLENHVAQLEVDKQYWEHATRQRYAKNDSITVPSKNVLKASERYAIALRDSGLEALRVASFFANGTAAIAILFFLICGRKSKSKQHLSGRKISAAWIVSLKLKLTRKASPIHIGSIPMVKGTEPQHMLITGGTGTGKSNCLHLILKQIREQKQKAIIIDTTGAFLDRHYSQDKDIILSPFHDLTAKWHPWAECKTPFDFAEIAESFIPHSHSEHDNYWRQATRTLFSSTLQKFNGEFSVIAPPQPNNTKFSEQSMPSGYAIIFESLNMGQTIRYDIWPIKDSEMLIELGFNINYQKAFLKAFFSDNIFSIYEENHLGLKFVSEDFIVKDDSIYYLAILNGPTGGVGALVAIKDKNLIVISLHSAFPFTENLNITTQEQSTSLINYFEGFHVE